MKRQAQRDPESETEASQPSSDGGGDGGGGLGGGGEGGGGEGGSGGGEGGGGRGEGEQADTYSQYELDPVTPALLHAAQPLQPFAMTLPS